MSAGMTVDGIEKTARDYRRACEITGNSGITPDRIAEFLLAVLPVVRAAEAWRETEASDLTYAASYQHRTAQGCRGHPARGDGGQVTPQTTEAP